MREDEQYDARQKTVHERCAQVAIFYPTEKLGWILDEEMHTQ